MVDKFSLWHREGIFPLLTTNVWGSLNPLFSHYRNLTYQGVTRLDHEADNFHLGLRLGLFYVPPSCTFTVFSWCTGTMWIFHTVPVHQQLPSCVPIITYHYTWVDDRMHEMIFITR